MPHHPHRRDDLGCAAVAILAFALWTWRWGWPGVHFDADATAASAIALRPLARSSLYLWGADKQGMLLPLLGKALHQLFGGDIVPLMQEIYYATAAAALGVLLRLLRSWPARLPLAALLLFPSYAMAVSLITPAYFLPTALLFTGLHTFAFRRAQAKPTPGALALATGSATFLAWIAYNAVVALGPEALLASAALVRCHRNVRPAHIAAALLGAVPGLLLILLSRGQAHRVGLFRLLPPREALQTALDSGDSLHALWPAVPAALIFALLFALAAFGLFALRAALRTDAPASPLALFGLVPLAGFGATAFTEWFRLNQFDPRYLSYFIALAVLALGAALDELGARGKGLVWFGTGALAVWTALAAGWSRASPEGRVWTDRLVFAESDGCKRIVGDHWHSYPYFALSNGEVLAHPDASPEFNDLLQHEVAAGPEICFQTEDPTAPCHPTWNFDWKDYALVRETSGEVDGSPQRLCHYVGPLPKHP